MRDDGEARRRAEEDERWGGDGGGCRDRGDLRVQITVLMAGVDLLHRQLDANGSAPEDDGEGRRAQRSLREGPLGSDQDAYYCAGPPGVGSRSRYMRMTKVSVLGQ